MVQWSLSKQITIDYQDIWYRSIDQDSNALSFFNAFILLDFHLFIKLSQILPWPRLSWREFTDLLATRELVRINWMDIKTLESYVITQHAHRNLQQGLYEIVSFKSPIIILFLKTWSLHLWPWHEPLRDTSSITCTDFRWSQLTAWGSSCSFPKKHNVMTMKQQQATLLVLWCRVSSFIYISLLFLLQSLQISYDMEESFVWFFDSTWKYDCLPP